MKRYLKFIMPVAALLIGLAIGLGIGQVKISSVKKAAQDKVKEAQKKVAFLQNQLMEAQGAQSTPQADPACLADLEKLKKEQATFRNELKKTQDKGNEKEMLLERKIREANDLTAHTKKDLQAMEQRCNQEAKHEKELEADLRKTVSEKLALQAELKKTNRNLGQCGANNAKLGDIANEILKKYRNKGVTAALLQEEPLTQKKKVELEHLSQQYKDEIDKQKFQAR